MIVEQTNKILKDENIKPKKIFGQNFLKEKKVIEDIINIANLNGEDYVIEIGPGLGSLTERLCQNSNKVLCYEIDNELAKLLPQRLASYNNYKIINEDFLKRNLSQDIDEFFERNKSIKVVANIPYNITTPIMMTLLREKQIKKVVLMVQNELADRFSAKPSNKEYGSISACLNYYGNIKKERVVKRACFEPIPNVDSAVISFTKNDRDIDEKFLDFLKVCFHQKRKKLTNNLEGYCSYNKNKLEEVLNVLNFSNTVRAEELNAEQLYELFLKLRKTNEN